MLAFSVHDFDLLVNDWANGLDWPVEPLIRLALAALLGGLVGLEREVRGRQAGFRTNLLVALGCALIMIVSISFASHPWPPHAPNFSVSVDPARIAYGVMAGIGFLGAGVIVKYEGGVHGLTTAAGLWCVAAIGLACGVGLYLIALSAAVLVLALFTVTFVAQGLSHLFGEPEGQGVA
jgi:putative Mg2+ transporter-C (MgtC) family protein